VAKRTLDRSDNLTHHQWPVSPTEYPLSGPSKGEVYVPPPRTRHLPATILAIMGYMFAFGFVGYVLVKFIFKGAL
jgi:hypothetical protein